MEVTRDHRYDTMRFILMLLVIVAHQAELFLGGGVLTLYKIIYTFHMPAFIFLTGKFARFDKKRVLRHLCLPYAVFQVLYLCFDAFVLKGTLKIQFTTPYWILWYLLAIIFMYALIPFLPEKGSPWSFIVLIVVFEAAVLVGFDTTVGYYMTLSRFVVFLPFFLLGYYSDSVAGFIKKRISIKPSLCAVLSLIAVSVGEFVIIRGKYPVQLLYGSYSYEACRNTPPCKELLSC